MADFNVDATHRKNEPAQPLLLSMNPKTDGPTTESFSSFGNQHRVVLSSLPPPPTPRLVDRVSLEERAREVMRRVKAMSEAPSSTVTRVVSSADELLNPQPFSVSSCSISSAVEEDRCDAESVISNYV